MPKSMTGFGRGECIRYDRRIKVEIKAVNHRHSDVTIKLPRFLSHLEDRVRQRLAQAIVRGKVDVWVNFESFAQKDAVVNVDKSLADAYVAALTELSHRYNWGPLEANPALELLAKNPDIMTLDKFAATSETDQAEIWETLSDALESALAGFDGMRRAEGAAMAQDVEANLEAAQKIVDHIAARAPQALEAQAAKTRERIEEMVQKLAQRPDEGRLITEMAILADKGCISEEIARLQSHFSQLSVMLTLDEAIGRKLDFWVQELNREANTIGSKSGDVGMTALVVELKSYIEKMREQAQNIE
ncbi:MAG: YicC family protein [Defluviitaleaceae bacterium]|nr:YicC family protein [Defluviitaleaceae bacterium]